MNELPELPDTAIYYLDLFKGNYPVFSAEQMRSYALSAVQMEREKQNARHDGIMEAVAEYGRAEWLDGSHATEDTLEMKEQAFAKVAAAIRSPAKEGEER
jgi:hypothetical protein